jgi:hypothetical protein
MLRPKALALPVMNQTLNMKSAFLRMEHSRLGGKRIRRDFLRPESLAAGQPGQHPLFLKGTLLPRDKAVYKMFRIPALGMSSLTG